MKIRNASLILAALIACVGLVTAAPPIAAEKETIKGQVTYGAPVPDATVTLLQGEVKKDTKTTDANGKFIFKKVAPGDYTLEATGIAKNKRRKGSAPAVMPESLEEQTVTIKLEL